MVRIQWETKNVGIRTQTTIVRVVLLRKPIGTLAVPGKHRSSLYTFLFKHFWDIRNYFFCGVRSLRFRARIQEGLSCIPGWWKHQSSDGLYPICRKRIQTCLRNIYFPEP